MKIALLGGTRFIGAAAAARAISRGHQVTVLHRGVHPNKHARATSVLVDRTDKDALRVALETLRPHAIIDTRSMTATDAAIVISAAEGQNASIVVLSSQDVYAQFGRLLGHPCKANETFVSEDSPLTVPYPYRGLGDSHADPEYDKKKVERCFFDAVVSGRFPSVVMLRLPPVYGPGDPRCRFGGIVRALKKGDGTLPHRGGASWRWTHSHVEDVAHAIILAAESSKTGYHVFNVGEPETPTMGQWAEYFAEYMNKELRWVEAQAELPEELSHLGIMPTDVVIDSRRIREELDYEEVTSFEMRIQDIVHWGSAL